MLKTQQYTIGDLGETVKKKKIHDENNFSDNVE